MNNNIIEKMKNESKKYEDYILSSVDEDNDYIIGWINNPFEENQDTPIVVYDKKKGDFKTQSMPPNYNVDSIKEIWNFNNDEDYCIDNKEKIEKMAGMKMDFENKNVEKDLENKTNYGEEKIRKLLAQYGAEESEIENFMNDLNDTKEELEEDVADEDYVLNQDTINKLKETQDGINLLIKAPEMAKEELKKAIADYLQK